MTTSLFETRLTRPQLEQLRELVAHFAYHLRQNELCPADDAALERIEAQKALMQCRMFLNRHGILTSLHQERLQMMILDWFQAQNSPVRIEELFEQIKTRKLKDNALLIVPWSGAQPSIPWRETAQGHGFDTALASTRNP
jgi:hypothetical protein